MEGMQATGLVEVIHHVRAEKPPALGERGCEWQGEDRLGAQNL